MEKDCNCSTSEEIFRLSSRGRILSNLQELLSDSPVNVSKEEFDAALFLGHNLRRGPTVFEKTKIFRFWASLFSRSVCHRNSLAEILMRRTGSLCTDMFRAVKLPTP